MIKFEAQNEERERRKRQREREWHLFMDEINMLQDKLNTFKQRKSNAQDSIEEQLHFIRVIYIKTFAQYLKIICRFRIKN